MTPHSILLCLACALLSMTVAGSARQASAPGLEALLAALPPLHSLEQRSDGSLILFDSEAGLHLVLREDSSWSSKRLSGFVPGGRPLLLPGETDSRLGLHLLCSDPGGGRLLQLNARFGLEGQVSIPQDKFNLRRPWLLCVSATRWVLTCDLEEPSLARFHSTSGWSPLLDYSHLGVGRPRSLEVLGEQVYLLLDRRTGPVLVFCGTEGGWSEERDMPGLLALHRRQKHLLLLLREGDRLVLRRIERADQLQSIRQVGLPQLASWPWPEMPGRLRDFLLLEEGLLLAPEEGRAMLLPPPEPLR